MKLLPPSTLRNLRQVKTHVVLKDKQRACMSEIEVIKEEGQRAKTGHQDSQSQDQSLRARRCVGLAEKKDTSGTLAQTRISSRTSPSIKEVAVEVMLLL